MSKYRRYNNRPNKHNNKKPNKPNNHSRPKMEQQCLYQYKTAKQLTRTQNAFALPLMRSTTHERFSQHNNKVGL